MLAHNQSINLLLFLQKQNLSHACCNMHAAIHKQQVCNNMLVRRCSMHAARLDSMFARVACMLQYTLLMCYLPTAYHLMVAQAAGLDGHVP